jgi:hypothetical protein
LIVARLETASAPATAQEIVEITGKLEAATLTSIIETGATRLEVLDAFVRCTADDALDPAIGPALGAAARLVFDILRAEFEPPDDP